MKKRFLALLLALCMLLSWMPMTAAAAETASGTHGDNLTWTLDENGTLTISGEGEMLTPAQPTWLEYKDSIVKVVIGEGITTVSQNAFIWCGAMTTLVLPEGLTTIGSGAFCGCIGLTELEIPTTVTTVGNGAFSGTKFEKLVIPGTMQTVGYGAFRECVVQTLVLEEGIEVIGNGAFTSIGVERMALPSSLKRIGMNAFMYAYEPLPRPDGVPSPNQLIIPENVEFIDKCAFFSCDTIAIFLGDAPELATDALVSLGTIYYPADNATWTEEYRNAANYGLTWIPYGTCDILEGADSVVTAQDSVTVRVDGEFSEFLYVFVDNLPLRENEYTVAEGSTVVTLNPEYLSTLAYGEHTLRVMFSDGMATTTFTLQKPASVQRLAGANRYETAVLVADQLKQTLGVEKFDAIILANGYNFADALSGSYLASVKNAPILLTWNGNEKYDYLNEYTVEYVKENLAEGGTVYILGGTSAVPETVDAMLEGCNVVRLAGANRFETNLLILKEAGIGSKDILVCTGTNFADSLSGSAAGLPILLVYKDLTEDQLSFLRENFSNNSFVIVGGESAVGTDVETTLAEHGYDFDRLAGATRFETSVLIAERFFESPESAVLAYAWDFPDGLCGGALAYAMDAPLILTMDKYEAEAAEYVQGMGIESGIVLGGTGLISDESVQTIFAK